MTNYHILTVLWHADGPPMVLTREVVTGPKHAARILKRLQGDQAEPWRMTGELTTVIKRKVYLA
jgi:hypothetical protein